MFHGIFFIFAVCAIYLYCKQILKRVAERRRAEFAALQREPTCQHNETDENYISELYILGECADHSDMDYLH